MKWAGDFGTSQGYPVGVIRVGPAGWSYKDWAGTVYPAPKPRRFDPVAYLARYFDTIEINSSYYGPPPPNRSQEVGRKRRRESELSFHREALPLLHSRAEAGTH
jgi:hypothetical protein